MKQSILHQNTNDEFEDDHREALKTWLPIKRSGIFTRFGGESHNAMGVLQLSSVSFQGVRTKSLAVYKYKSR